MGDPVLQGRKQLCESTRPQKRPHTQRVWLVLNLPWFPEGQPVPVRTRVLLAVPSQAQGTQGDPKEAVLTEWSAGFHPPLKVLSVYIENTPNKLGHCPDSYFK